LGVFGGEKAGGVRTVGLKKFVRPRVIEFEANSFKGRFGEARFKGFGYRKGRIEGFGEEENLNFAIATLEDLYRELKLVVAHESKEGGFKRWALKENGAKYGK
jgi:hypothetical protein